MLPPCRDKTAVRAYLYIFSVCELWIACRVTYVVASGMYRWNSCDTTIRVLRMAPLIRYAHNKKNSETHLKRLSRV